MTIAQTATNGLNSLVLPPQFNLTDADIEKYRQKFITREMLENEQRRRVDDLSARETLNFGALTDSSRKYKDCSGIVYIYRTFFNEDRLNQPRQYRVRRDNPKLTEKSGKEIAGAKYLSAPGANNMFYVPHGVKVEWLKDILIPVVIFEGEDKAVAAARVASEDFTLDKWRFIPVALSGVWNFRTKTPKTKDNGEKRPINSLLPDFQYFEWKNRDSIVFYDANVHTNFEVKRARTDLSFELEHLGANVKFAELPKKFADGKDGVNGFDDYLFYISQKQKSDLVAISEGWRLIEEAFPARRKPQSDNSRFHLRSDGVYFMNDKGQEEWLCGPLEIVAETHTENGENYGRFLEWRDSKGRLHSWPMPVELVHSDSNEHIKHLASHGLEIQIGKPFRDRISQYIGLSKPAKTFISTDQTGWKDHGRCFVMPDRTIGEAVDTETKTVFQTIGKGEHKYFTSGSLNDWRENIARYAVGNSRLVFAISAAFAACLITPLNYLESFGFHFRGRTSKGKTTTVMVAGSVWGGDGVKGNYRPWRMTDNALEAVAALHNDALLCLDEIKQADPRKVLNILYMLGNNEGKGRLQKTIQLRKSFSWKTLFLSTGEFGLNEIAAQTNERSYGGVKTRFVELPAEVKKGQGLFENIHGFEHSAAFVSALRENCLKYYGTAIIEFLNSIIPQLEEIKKDWIDFREIFTSDVESWIGTDPPAEVRRVVGHFALVAYAGRLVSDLCGWDENEVFNAVEIIFKDWFATQSDKGADADDAIKQVRLFLSRYGDARFELLEKTAPQSNSPLMVSVPPTDRKPFDRAGYRKVITNNIGNDEETIFYILPEVFEKEICKGFDKTEVANDLNRAGFLITDHGRLQKSQKIPNHEKAVRFYAVSSKIFEDDQEVSDGSRNDGDSTSDLTF